MATRMELLGHLWGEVINGYLRGDAIDNIIAACERAPADAPFAEAGPILKKMLASGVSKREIALLQRASAYEAVFATLYALDDPGVDNDDVFGLHEELLGADPSGMDGRPGSADAVVK